MPTGIITIGKQRDPSTEAINVRVDRQSALGNPFPLKDEAYRDIICDAYRAHLVHKIKAKNRPIIAELKRIYNLVIAGHDVQLNCWCAPKRCHADFIKLTVEKAVEKANG